MNGSTADDEEFAGIVLWLLATGQEAHVDRWGNLTLKTSRHFKLRERRRNDTIAMSKAELKRLRKMAKHATV